jgi:hypothetical protein
MLKHWTWSLPARPSWAMALNAVFFAAWMQLPWHFTPFRQGLVMGLAIMLLVEMLRARAVVGVLLGAFAIVVVRITEPRTGTQPLWSVLFDFAPMAMLLVSWLFLWWKQRTQPAMEPRSA